LQKNIPNKESLKVEIIGEHEGSFNSVITKLCNLENIEKVDEKTSGSVSFLVDITEYAIPLGNLIDAEEEIKKMETEIKYYEGFLESVKKKLGNDKFVSNAKTEVVEAERKKLTDAQSKIVSLKDSIEALKK